MARRRTRKDPYSRKYGAPLYAVAWPTGDYVFLAGGGGKANCGIPNRIVVARHQDGKLSDEVGQLLTGTDTPVRMAAHPSGRSLLVAWGISGLARIDVDTTTRVPQLTRATGPQAERLASLGLAKCLAFSGDGRWLAIGGEAGAVQVLEYPSLRTRLHLRGDHGLRDTLRDVDFSPAHHYRVLATTCESGSCLLWHWEEGLPLAALQLPPDLQRGSFNRCRFARDGSTALYTAVNRAGEGHLLAWRQDAAGELQLHARLKLHASAITTFDISPDGQYLGTGTSEGELAVVSTAKFVPVRRVKDGHMIFATALAFAPSGDDMVSVSADASARATAAVQQPLVTWSFLAHPAFLGLLLAALFGLFCATVMWVVSELDDAQVDELFPAWLGKPLRGTVRHKGEL